MKNLVLTIITLCLTQVLLAQTTAAEYMKRAPGIPVNICKTTGSDQDAFIDAVRNLSSVIRKDAQTRSKEADKFMEANEVEIKTNMLKQSGMSDEDIKSLENGKEMTDAEAMALADKMIRQKANISLEEVENVSKMSEAEKQAWAQGKAVGQLAGAQANPGQIKGTNDTIMSLLDLISEQTSLQNKVLTKENQLREKYMAIDQDAITANLVLGTALKPFYDELNRINDGEGSTKADTEHADRVMKKIREKQDAYCEIFTPRMLEFIKECKNYFAEALPDYDRLEEIQASITATQTGLKPMTAGKGMNSLQAVDRYLEYLVGAFRYKLYRTD